MAIGSLKEILADWYQGKYVPYENDPRSSVFIVGGGYERHWTALAARKLVEFWFTHWQWTIGTVLALVGLYFAVVKG
ncbi:UNVERIFIED_ORG: hypothetical protein J2740_001118 [Rhizobium nepotum]|nr:hypothetical protein [Rhizobium nepotum]